jgi:hypothetical protein
MPPVSFIQTPYKRIASSHPKAKTVAPLSVARWQHDGLIQTLDCKESFSGCSHPKKSEMKAFKNEISTPASLSNGMSISETLIRQDVEEDYIMIDASSAAFEYSRAEAQNTSDTPLRTNGESVVEPLRRITIPGPPKRFHRRGALWASITRRMLHLAQSAQSALRFPINGVQ